MHINVLSVENLAIARDERRLFEALSFTIDSGHALAVKGANGCGKSTLLNGLCGLLPIEIGKITLKFENGETLEGAHALADFTHHLGHQNAMQQDLTVEENLSFWQKFSGGDDTSIDDALDALKLNHTKTMPFGFLSTGQRRRIAIARLMVNFRPLWLLDEPTSGLDTGSVVLFESLMDNHLKAGGIIIAATHLPLGNKRDWQSLDLTTFSLMGDGS